MDSSNDSKTDDVPLPPGVDYADYESRPNRSSSADRDRYRNRRTESKTEFGDRDYRELADSYQEKKGSFRDVKDNYRKVRESYPGERDSYRDGRESYRDRKESYRDSKDSYRDSKDGYRDSKDTYRDSKESYRDSKEYRDTKDNYRSKSREYERRSYRDRSRERDRSWDRDRDRCRDRTRDKYGRDGNIEYRDDIPNSTILMRNLPPDVSEDDIRNEASRYTLYPQDVVISKRSSGESKRNAFVEFRLLSDAVRWKEVTEGVIYFGQVSATLHYHYVSKDGLERGPKKNDWTCAKCGASNFGKRDFCFRCSIPREESNKLGNEGFEEVSLSPSSTLLFRNLDILTNEERVLTMLGQLTVLPIKNLKVAKDPLTNTSRGFAYVELHTVSQAIQLHDLLMGMSGNFFVDGRRITVSYSRKSLAFLNSAASATAASAALAAAQWANQGNTSMFSENTIKGKSMESVQSLNAGSANGTYMPDVSAYQYDATSGYYYDASTGYYYDATTQYYYNSKTQQYLYWDIGKEAYTIVPTSESATPAVIQAAPSISKAKVEAVVSSSAVISQRPVPTAKKEEAKDKSNPQDKVKIAKKVAKDMEKWAKTLNQKKENAKMMSNSNLVQRAPIEQPSTSSIEARNIEDTLLAHLVQEQNGQTSELREKPMTFAIYGGDSDPEYDNEPQDEGTKAEEYLKSEENKLIDYEKMACLLCKRQFPSIDVLTKHVQLSELHKHNVDVLKLTKLSAFQAQELEKKESGYRDRAKERRQKFGQPDAPPVSRLKARYMKEREVYQPVEAPVEAIGSNNIGNKMLKAMGWSEGQGLGKEGQGMSGIIEVQRRVKSAGLGMKGSSYGASASDSYKETVRKAMQARYNDVS